MLPFSFGFRLGFFFSDFFYFTLFYFIYSFFRGGGGRGNRCLCVFELRFTCILFCFVQFCFVGFFIGFFFSFVLARRSELSNGNGQYEVLGHI